MHDGRHSRGYASMAAGAVCACWRLTLGALPACSSPYSLRPSLSITARVCVHQSNLWMWVPYLRLLGAGITDCHHNHLAFVWVPGT